MITVSWRFGAAEYTKHFSQRYLADLWISRIVKDSPSKVQLECERRYDITWGIGSNGELVIHYMNE